MTNTLKQWGKGLLLSVLAMTIYAVSLGCFISLMLLVISMEEGGDNLAEHAVPLTQAVVLLSQGVGFSSGSFTLTITPLGLTILLVALLAALARRLRIASIHALAAGLFAWLALDIMLRQGVQVELTDDLPLCLAKCAAVYALAMLCAAGASARVRQGVASLIRDHIGEPVRHCLACGVMLTVCLLTVYAVCAIVTVIAWIWMNHDTMATVFDMSGMQTGSRILTTIASLIWLPNLCVWAESWLFGGGFQIGELGTFTLWLGQSNELPAVPAFGLFPSAIENDMLRMTFVMLPLGIAVVFALLMIFLPAGFGYRPSRLLRGETDMRMAFELAYPGAACCLAGAMTTVCSTAIFALSNGALGQHRLAHVGVDVMRSTQTVSRPTALGLVLAWALALVGTALVFSIVWFRKRYAHDDRPSAPRAVRGGTNQAPTAAGATPTQTAIDLQPFNPQSKEEQDDNHEPTDSPSTGIGLP